MVALGRTQVTGEGPREDTGEGPRVSIIGEGGRGGLWVGLLAEGALAPATRANGDGAADGASNRCSRAFDPRPSPCDLQMASSPLTPTRASPPGEDGRAPPDASTGESSASTSEPAAEPCQMARPAPQGRLGQVPTRGTWVSAGLHATHPKEHVDVVQWRALVVSTPEEEELAPVDEGPEAGRAGLVHTRPGSSSGSVAAPRLAASSDVFTTAPCPAAAIGNKGQREAATSIDTRGRCQGSPELWVNGTPPPPLGIASAAA